MRFSDAVSRLNARQPEHMPGPSLDRIREIAGLLDQPQLTYPSIHITGTNGKTTAARVAASVACAHGITVGLYTSPHLLSVTERLSICGQDITEGEFAQEWEHLEPFLQLVDGRGFGEVTYFEAVTALAYLWFADKPVGLGVFEVGLGGTWDATNLVDGEVAVVTPIGMDHVAELGPTLVDIAGEKAGILKPGATAVFREQEPAAAAVLAGRAAEVGST
ncbi:MAG TPA: Mur ligase family protein, partial [Actinomycetota bacterium]